MVFETDKLLTILVDVGSFIAVFAAIVAGVLMSQVTKKFGTGILATGFKSISFGVFFIAAGILIDAITSYLQVSGSSFQLMTILILIKEAFFVIGTYIIVIGSKNTGDKLESLTK